MYHVLDRIDMRETACTPQTCTLGVLIVEQILKELDDPNLNPEEHEVI